MLAEFSDLRFGFEVIRQILSRPRMLLPLTSFANPSLSSIYLQANPLMFPLTVLKNNCVEKRLKTRILCHLEHVAAFDRVPGIGLRFTRYASFN